MQFLLELSDAISFPADSFLQLMEGVNKLPTWTVYPKQLCACIKATAAIVRSRQRYGRSLAQPGTAPTKASERLLTGVARPNAAVPC